MKLFLRILFVMACFSAAVFTLWMLLLNIGFGKVYPIGVTPFVMIDCLFMIMGLPLLIYYSPRLGGISGVIAFLGISFMWFPEMTDYLYVAVIQYGLFMDHFLYIWCFLMYIWVVVFSIYMIAKPWEKKKIYRSETLEK